MEHDVLLMVLVGAGLLALGGLARGLPGWTGALASSPAGVGSSYPAEWALGATAAQLTFDTDADGASLADGGVRWSPYRVARVRVPRGHRTPGGHPDSAWFRIARVV
jgi:hypothetical protein